MPPLPEEEEAAAEEGSSRRLLTSRRCSRRSAASDGTRRDEGSRPRVPLTPHRGPARPPAPGRGSAAPPAPLPGPGLRRPPAGSTVENKSGLLIYCSGGEAGGGGGRCERKSKPVFFPETAVLPGIPPSHPGDNPPPAKDEQKPRCPRHRRSSGPSNRPGEAAEEGPGGGTGYWRGERGSPCLGGGTWDRASERRVYPAIALSPDLNHSIRNQNSLKRESARVLFTRSVPSTRTDGRTDGSSARTRGCSRTRAPAARAQRRAPRSRQQQPRAPSGLGRAFCSQSCLSNVRFRFPK